MAINLPQAVTGSYNGPAHLPTYDRSTVRAGIVHFGVGGFHRSHQAFYLDQLLERGLADEWGICGVGVLENDSKMRDVVQNQQGLYTLLEKSPDGTIAGRVIGSMVEYLYAPDDPTAVIEKLAQPEIRIVTLTITEGGYNLEPATKEFDATNEVIQAEAAGEGAPRTHFRFLHEGLKLRRERGLEPFTIATCDNIQGNGEIARTTLVQYIALSDKEFAAWVSENVEFPNSMVDRITPVTADEDREIARERFGLEDAWPVPAESFIQWVLEDTFPQGRPPLEEVGVQMVYNVLPYELMKLRLLNASHQVIGYFSFLRGHEYVHEAMADPLIHDIVAQFQELEAQPTLQPVPGVDLAEYRATLLSRFSNPGIRDTIARQCLQTSTTIPNFLLPIIRDQLVAGGDIRRGAATVAAWAEYAAEGGEWTIVDRRRDTVHARAIDPNPYVFIEDVELFGDLATNEQFREAFAAARALIREHGIDTALKELTS